MRLNLDLDCGGQRRCEPDGKPGQQDEASQAGSPMWGVLFSGGQQPSALAPPLYGISVGMFVTQKTSSLMKKGLDKVSIIPYTCSHNVRLLH